MSGMERPRRGVERCQTAISSRILGLETGLPGYTGKERKPWLHWDREPKWTGFGGTGSEPDSPVLWELPQSSWAEGSRMML